MRTLTVAVLTSLVAVATLAAVTRATTATGPQVALKLQDADAGYELLTDSYVFTSSDQNPTNPATISVTPTAGATVTAADVELQSSPAGADNWTPLNASVEAHGAGTYEAELSYYAFSGPGVYDVRAYVTQSDGQNGTSPTVADVVVVDDADVSGGSAPMNYIGLENPGSELRGSVALTAALWNSTFSSLAANITVPPTVDFQLSPTGQNNWTTVATASPEVNASGQPVTISGGQQVYTATVDTTQLADGLYDMRVQDDPSDPNQPNFIGAQISQVRIDNTPPTVSLASPGQTLSGDVPLRASAADSGSGVGSVRFEYQTPGSSDWTTIGVISSPPYTDSFDTRGVENGNYVLRAIAADLAGNTTVSNVVSGVTVTNQTSGFNAAGLSITPVVAPASDVQMLGQVAGSPDGEAWAYGYTTAEPAVVSGSPLPYTAPSGTPQLVLLEYTDQTGWQIADVLRNADGTPYPISGHVTVSGELVGSGEAWLVVTQAGQTELFHRAPGGEFREDAAATATVAPLIPKYSTNEQLRLGVASDGTVYGTLTNTDQATETEEGVQTQLQYAQLTGGQWKVAQATLPPGFPGTGLTLESMAPAGPQSGWAIFRPTAKTGVSAPVVIGEYTAAGWTYPASTGLDALDLTGTFALSTATVAGKDIEVGPEGVWFEASVNDATESISGGEVIALFDPTTGHVVGSWCAASVFAVSSGCGQLLDANHPAMVPDADFETASGPVAIGLADGYLDVYSAGVWTAVPATGFDGGPGESSFSSASSGWLAGANAVGLVTEGSPTSALTSWPAANQHTLMDVALPSGGASTSTSGALAVGLDGTALHYDAQNGWLVDPVPTAALSANLFGVAFAGSSGHAVAVGSLGTILDWNGSAWSEDPQSNSLTPYQLNAVAFAPDGEGWAVGAYGTILHYDGTSWAPEQIDAEDAGADVTSVAVAGSEVLAVAGGNLITRSADGTWSRVAGSTLPASLPPNSLTKVAGLSDGGAAAAGDSFVIERQSAGADWEYSDQPVQGRAVALAAFRQASGAVGAFVSVAPPPAASSFLGTVFPSGDGDLLLQTSGGWRDLSEDQFPASSVPQEGEPEPTPVLAVAAAPDGSAAWAVGGYAGTVTASGLGVAAPLQSIPQAWQTSSIQRYDEGGSASPPSQTQTQVTIPAQPDTVSFAFFSSAFCQVECASVQDAQPDANLAGAAAQMAAFAAQPGGPVFAMEGGNAVGPLNDYSAGNGAVDLARFTQVMAPLGSLPLYAALGPYDKVPTSTDPLTPWASAFAEQPAPFGAGATPAGVAPVSTGGSEQSVNRYYAFDVAQNGGTLRVIVLDNSAGSLDASDPGQSAWLTDQLAAAQQSSVPVVVFCNEPLSASNPNHATDADAVATQLAAAGVLGVFTSPGGTSETNQIEQIPSDAAAGAPTIPEYEGATLGYQQSNNNGVLWYFGSVDTATGTLTVQAIPVIKSLALDPRSGLTVTQSSTLLFSGIGQRPLGTNATTASGNASVQGYASYVSIPSSGGVAPSYQFTSSVPGIGTFVKASPGSPDYPLLTSSGKTQPSSTSGLFCAYNPGTTVVSLTSGLLTTSLTVTVKAGAVGQPCGTVNYAPDDQVIQLQGKTLVQTASAAPNAPLQTGAPKVSPEVHVTPRLHFTTPAPVSKVQVTHPRPHPHPRPAPPAPHHPPAPLVSPPFIAVPSPFDTTSAAITPPIPPPITPVPPGGATAPAQSTAKREEKARKHASQSAYVTRPAGVSSDEWFFGGVGVMTVVALALIAGGLRPRPRARPAFVELTTDDPRRRRRNR